ncbi:MAG TPA: tyrosine--tRNA ligase [Candidatus Saccharimonadales bacterium]|nr:tyrosine--tRNA ligase [Candidatus Saccharimonadales bacterium]
MLYSNQMDKIEELLTRGVDKIYPSKQELEKILKSGKKLRLYQGFDPTGTRLHIGHMVGFRKLRQWQELGHHVIFLIGDGTGQAGDPSGKTKARDKFMTQEELRKNAKDYILQARKIVNFEGDNPIEILYNGDWLNELKLLDILDIAGNFSLQQLSERDLFQERMKKGESVNLREFLYPLLQGYDSVAMNVDLEIGGSDQTFNMLAGRNLVKAMQNRDKFVMTTPLLTDSNGRKIGKTEGNVIGLTDEPNDLFGKIMGLSDDVIVKAFEYLTSLPIDEIKKLEKRLNTNEEHPMKAKKKLAGEIVSQLHSPEEAKIARDNFERTVQDREMPTDIPLFVLKEATSVAEVLVETGLTLSKSDAKRLIEQGGVEIDNERINDPNIPFETLAKNDETIIQVGKRKFIKVKLEK